MSKAFTKEDVDPPERSGRVRSASGLPPGAANYMTARGAQRLRKELAGRPRGGDERGEELRRLLASVTVVEPAEEPSDEVTFGAAVTVRDGAGEERTLRIVGVDELAFEPNALSWISDDGRSLLAAEIGGRVTLANGQTVTVIRIEQPVD